VVQNLITNEERVGQKKRKKKSMKRKKGHKNPRALDFRLKIKNLF